MSTINTNGLNVNYPVPGVNNNSQGFRNNFTNIKQNLDIAAAEITDLQTSVVVKNPLGNAAIDNDMANVLIANASTLGFRATTYNLGGDLVGPVLIDMGIADVHYGTLGGNILLSFGNWAPTGTLSKVTIEISTSSVANNYCIQLPGEVIVSSDNFGTPILNNFDVISNTPTLTFPHGCTQLILECYSTDCGNSIYITPVNRPYQSTQIIQRTPPSTGQYGDMTGAVCVDAAKSQLTVTSTVAATDYLVTANTSTLYTGMPVTFTGNIFESNISSATTYYVANIANSTHFTISANANSIGNMNVGTGSGTMYLNPVSYVYVATSDFNANVFNRSISSITAPNIITVSGSTANLAANMPIIFGGNATGNTGNIELNKVYYISSVNSSNITISQNRFNGVAGAEVKTLTTVSSNVDIDYTIYEGSDIFRRIPLQPF